MKYWIIIFLFSFPFHSISQELIVNDSISKGEIALQKSIWKFYAAPLAVVGRELAFGVENRYNKRQAINLLLGYRFSYQKDRGGYVQTIPYIKQFSDYDYHNVLNQFLWGVHVESNLKYYFGKRYLASWSIGVFMRNWSVEATEMLYDDEHGRSFETKRTERTYIGGVKTLFGREFPIYQFYNKNLLYLEMYGGASIRYKRMYYLSEEGLVNNISITKLEERKNKFIPGLQGGIRLGIAFHNKK